jgi:hypothetical protein
MQDGVGRPELASATMAPGRLRMRIGRRRWRAGRQGPLGGLHGSCCPRGNAAIAVSGPHVSDVVE